MITYFVDGRIFDGEKFLDANILVIDQKISKLGMISASALREFDAEVIDCRGCLIIPGLIDPHLHLSGGSGERGGFHTQALEILLSECIVGGVTTLVGTLGVDTTTKTMPDLVGKARSFTELGLTAYCYTGGYDIPPKTITDSVRNDLIYIPEIIGVGEVAIADRRAPEPELKDLARACVDSYVGGLLANKPGITHIHAGGGERRLQTLRDLFNHHTVFPANFHITHIGRSRELITEAIDLAKRGCFVDIDLWDQDFAHWYKVYREFDGPLSQLTVSSDAGWGEPAELFHELRSAVIKDGFPLEEILPHFTSNTARALKLNNKGRIAPGCDADMAIMDAKNLEMIHVISRGQVLMKEGKLNFPNRPKNTRRDFDIYGIRSKEAP